MRKIVGSTALKMYGYHSREPNDLDIFTDEEYYPKAFDHKGNVELHHVPTQILDLIPHGMGYATPDAIYTLKCSHAGWDIKWNKHIQDIMWLKRKGCKIIESLYWVFYKFWQETHKDKSFLNLNKTKGEFFDDYVDYKYDHDYLHNVVANPAVPMYTRVLKDNKEVLIDHSKFLGLEFEDQIKLFKEEIQVIALERFLIPNNFKRGKYEAYLMALKKTITNLTKNWATLFIVDNYELFCKMGSADWYYNFIKLNRKDLIMTTNAIKEIQDKAAEMGVEDDYDLEDMFLNGAIPDEDDKLKEFYDYLIKEHKYEHIMQEGGGEGGTEYCFAVIKLDDQCYRLEYSYASYDGYNVDDIWDWNPVTPVNREVTFYE